MVTHLGKRDFKRLMRIRDVVSEELLGQLVLSETLYYVLIDEVGLDEDEAEAMTQKMFSGGNTRDAKELAAVTQEDGIQYGVSARQMPFFMKRFMKSTRIQALDTNPIQWQMNGFKTFEKPYICGYERPSLQGLCAERQELLKKIEYLESKLATWPDNISELYQEKNYLTNQKNIIEDKIKDKARGVING